MNSNENILLYLYRIESHLTAENEDLSKKLEDRNAKIKNLAHQLNNHEANFKEIKDELNEVMKIKLKAY